MTKVYLQEVTACFECPAVDIGMCAEMCSLSQNRTIHDVENIPDWCPLENVVTEISHES